MASGSRLKQMSVLVDRWRRDRAKQMEQLLAPEVRGQRMEVRGHRMEVQDKVMEAGGQQTEGRRASIPAEEESLPIEEVLYRQARARLANRASRVQPQSPAEASAPLTWKEYLLYLMMFVFLGTSFVYTYLSYLLKEIRPTHNAMGVLSAHRLQGLGNRLPPPPTAPPIDAATLQRQQEELDEAYVLVSDYITPSKMLRNLTQFSACRVLGPEDSESPDDLSQLHVCRGQRPPPKGEDAHGVRLLTLFTTTFDTVIDQIPYTTTNMLELWPRLGARVRPVLFIYDPEEEATEARRACALGWDVLVAPSCDDDGAPYMAAMMRVTRQLEKTSFYGWAHRNTLFDMSLLHTLSFLRQQMENFPHNVIVGQRTNLKLLNFSPTLASLEVLEKQARARGTLGWLLNVDYFITTRGGHDLPSQMVAGARQIGNWVVWDALLTKTPVIDISNTTRAVHQMAWTVPRRVVFSEAALPDGLEPTFGTVWCAPLKVRAPPRSRNRMTLMKRVKYGLCGPRQWSQLPINQPDVPDDEEEEFLQGGGIMFQRWE